ncbi:MAG: hypothetical protein JXM70_16280 [Pirellulales bacterium]|nr:hypothetical protein [Pirellulales bacterium]
MKRILCSICVLVVIALTCGTRSFSSGEQASTSASVGERPRMLLNGVWDFRLDPEKLGETQKWWSENTDYPHKIPVPGIWQAHGFGEPGGIARHNYQGVAWFRRMFTAPKQWSGTRVWLRFEGICNHGDIFLNGQKVGRVETFITPYEFDVTDQIALGKKNILACRVNSDGPWAPPKGAATKNSMTWASDPALYLGSYVGMMQFLVHAGGINSHVILESRSDPRIDEVVVEPNLANRTVHACLHLTRQETGRNWEGNVAIRIKPAKGPGPEAAAHVAMTFSAEATQSNKANVTISLPELHSWSPEDPFLYVVDVTLSRGKETLDRRTFRTGFRELIATPEGNFLLNGKPYFLRGVGYDSLEPITGVPVPDKTVYAKRLRLLKRYGYNYIRLLAHTPLRELFEAADEVGILMQTEGEWFLGPNPMPEPTGDLFARQVPKMIREFRHHPSWFAFSCFNEAWNANTDPVKQKYVQTAYKTFRQEDPSRFFIASDGVDAWPTDIITAHLHGAMKKADVPDADPSSAKPIEVFEGLLDEIVLWGQAISAKTMRKLAETGSDAKAYRQKVMDLHPIAYWQLEEKGPIGKVGSALACGSSDHTAKGLSLAERAEEIVPQMQKSFSISLWSKPKPIPDTVFGDFFSCGAASPGCALILGYRGDGHIVVGRYNDNILTSKGTLHTGQWNHVGLTYDGQRIHLFINGELHGEVETTFTIPPRDLALGRLIQLGTRTAADYRSRPHVWHEFDNTYIAPLPDLEIEKRLTGVMTQTSILNPHRQRLEDYGIMSRYKEIRRLSIDLYREYVKSIFENARRMPRLDGYAWWGTTNDIPAGVETDVSSLAMLDMLYQPEKFVFEEFRKFNRESVLMVDADIDRRVLGSGKSQQLQIALSHYGPQPVKNGRLLWKICSGEKVLKEGVIEAVNAASGKITELGSITLGPFNCKEPLELRVQVELEADACRQSNDWKFWVFPEKKRDMPVATICNLTGEPSLDRRYGASGPSSLENADLVLARKITPEVLKYLKSGGRVIFLTQDAGRAAVHRPPVIWNEDMAAESAAIQRAGFLKSPGVLGYWARWIRCNAQIVESHDSLSSFPHDNFADFQLMRLYGRITGSVDFTPKNSLARSKVKPIIWSLDLAPWSQEPSPHGVVLTWHGLLNECRVQKGRAILCTLYVLDGVKTGLPEAGYLLDCLVDYALSDRFQPATPPFTLEEARQFFKTE